MNIKDLRSWGREQLRVLGLGVDTLTLEVDVLLGHVLSCTRSWLLAYGEVDVSDKDRNLFSELIERRRKFEPVAYLIGKKEFYGLEFFVTPAVLIPRPETELLIEQAFHRLLELSENLRSPVILVDVGTGSGILILTLLYLIRQRFGVLPKGVVTALAIELSKDAIEVARKNAQHLDLSGQVTFIQGDLLSAVSLGNQDKVLVVVSNPPYIPDFTTLPADIGEYEPALALWGGEQGMSVIKRLFEELPFYLSTRLGTCLIEIGSGQDVLVESLVSKMFGYNCLFYRDLCNINRVVEIKRNNVGARIFND